MSLRVLVADVSPTCRDRYTRFFTERGWHVETATGGIECLEKLSNFTPHLLFLDLDIPWGGGDGVLDRLREAAGGNHPAVVLTGGGTTVATLQRQAAPPVVKWLLKPFDDMELCEIVGWAQKCPA